MITAVGPTTFTELLEGLKVLAEHHLDDPRGVKVIIDYAGENLELVGSMDLMRDEATGVYTVGLHARKQTD